MSDTTRQDSAERAPALDDKLEPPEKRKWTGPLAWMAKNSVAANILMIILLLGGYVKMQDLVQEVFPEFELDLILINVPYPGASPEEVEQGVILSIEEQVRGIDGVKNIRSSANESLAVVTVELLLGTNADQALNDVKAAIDRITSFPEEIERPLVFKAKFQNQVLALALHGDEPPHVLKDLAEKTRDGLLQDPRITTVEISGLPPLEVSIEISQDNLRRYGLTLDQVSALIKRSSIELPGGTIKTRGGEILLRTTERRDRGEEFANIVIRSMPDGSKLYLGDIATITDGFAETDQKAYYKGRPSVMISIFRVGKQTPIDISQAAHEYIAQHSHELPPGVEMNPWADTSEWYRGRRDLLLRNAGLGLILVLIILGLFLEVKLAFWVTMGIPISFVGSLLFLPMTDISINMISLFAFIVVLGMVVDDAIIVGEAIYRRRSEGADRIEAAILGVREVAAPVTFAIITTIVAYMPMLFVPGIMGKFFRLIPIVVIAVLLMSLIESLFILPAHLAHLKNKRSERGLFGLLHHQQQRFSRFLEWQIEKLYVPVARAATRRRYFTIATAFAIFIGTMGLIAGGRVAFESFPSVEGDIVVSAIEMPFGTDVGRTHEVQERVLSAAYDVLNENGGADNITLGIYSNVGASNLVRNDPGAPFTSGGHLSEVAIFLVQADERDITTGEFVRQWRERIGEVPGIERLRFTFDTGPVSGPPINVELRHPDLDYLRAAAQDLAGKIQTYAGVYDVVDGFEDGKQQLNLTLKPEAQSLGLSELDLARQIRSAFFGAEAVRQQRGRDEVKVYVRLPRSERESEYNLEELIVRTPQGGEIPLSQAAEIDRGQSFTVIRRINGRRAVSVTAEVDAALNNAQEVMGKVLSEELPALLERHPGITHKLGGDAMQTAEAFDSLKVGFFLAVMAMFALLAIAFRSYVQPIIVLLAIPFGMVGAVFGHMLMGFALSMMSMMGIVALAGVVVNDSLILIVAINRYREAGMGVQEAAVKGGALRFRAILLTSLTTFFGLAPMILETSVQARFLIPMAISLGFGVLLATFITLLLVPAVYVIVDDIGRGMRRIRGITSSQPLDVIEI